MTSDTSLSRRPVPPEAVAQIKRVTWTGLFVNLLLMALKFALGIIGGSQAVVADAVHSLSDMATDVAVIIGVKFWTVPPDENHPFGHRRFETLVTMGIGLALAAVAFGIGHRAIVTIRDPHLQPPLWIAAIAPALSIVLKEWLYRWTVRVGRRARSPAVVANAWHHRSDALSSIPALAAVAIAEIGPRYAFADHIGAIIISIFILKVAWDIAKPTLLELSGHAAAPADRQAIERIVSDVEGVETLHEIRTRRHGGMVLLDLHVLVRGDITVREGHDIAEEVKRRLIALGPSVADVMVHVEPYEAAHESAEGDQPADMDRPPGGG